MKRTCLFLLLVVALLWPHSNMAQGPISVQVDAAKATQYVKEHPGLSGAFVFNTNGTVVCKDESVLKAFNRYAQHSAPTAADVSSLGIPNKTEGSTMIPVAKKMTSPHAAETPAAAENQKMEAVDEQQTTKIVSDIERPTVAGEPTTPYKN